MATDKVTEKFDLRELRASPRCAGEKEDEHPIGDMYSDGLVDEGTLQWTCQQCHRRLQLALKVTYLEPEAQHKNTKGHETKTHETHETQGGHAHKK